ncbi:agouti-related protein isoform X5 [Marmota monax]|uniref:agouti-related protein n=1 Tax=Marmota flaviventris TaxID=93162 RepID=UPI0007626998|nr:agouti-related protein isoform X2 [Marmota flaviventris]XP_048648564.1 agouti-related protein [Marmota marmota marmota]XP_058431967.1 agouti-related protein isoform X5 [Marmota monax]KAG3257039.1 agouti related neuropeptide [Ictidomys tridecemlineatus]
MSQAMLTAVLLSCALLLALPTTLGAQMGLAPLEGIRRPDQALLPEFPGLGLQALLKKTTAEQSEEALLQKAEALAEMLDPQNRELRSPRRCVRLHESCLGQQVPCCDPCATCYCRFFNAFCYCRKLGTATNPCSRT